jgi:hypothetical protein
MNLEKLVEVDGRYLRYNANDITPPNFHLKISALVEK